MFSASTLQRAPGAPILQECTALMRHHSHPGGTQQQCRQRQWRGRPRQPSKSPPLRRLAPAAAAASPTQPGTSRTQLQLALPSDATMTQVYDLLADRVARQVQQQQQQGPYLVGVAGVPGSGKSTLVAEVCRRLNERCGIPAVVVPMDGFHYYRAQLDAMPDPQLAHARRGAEWTFDATKYLACLEGIKATGEQAVLRVGSHTARLHHTAHTCTPAAPPPPHHAYITLAP